MNTTEILTWPKYRPILGLGDGRIRPPLIA